MATEGEDRERDEGLGPVEPEGDAGEEPDLGVGGFDQRVRQPRFEGGVDGGSVRDDAALELDEGGEP